MGVPPIGRLSVQTCTMPDTDVESALAWRSTALPRRQENKGQAYVELLQN